MAKAEENKTPDEFPLSIEEFCASLSQNDRRVELIGAFHSAEKQAGRVKDLGSLYLKRYQDFANAPA
jgi:hypothetical protein